MKIGTKLLIFSLAIGIIPLAIIGSVSTFQGRQILAQRAFDQLESTREDHKAQVEDFFAERRRDMNVLLETVANLYQNAYQKLQTIQENKKSQVEEYFRERLNDISVLSKSEAIAEALQQFDGAFQGENKQIGGATWQSIEGTFGPELKQYKNEQGCDDLFLIAEHGDLVYTVNKRSDLGKNLLQGDLKNTPLGRSFQNGLQKLSLQDFEMYEPAHQYLAFLSAPLFRFGERVGVLVMTLPPDSLNHIMQQRAGMGKSGESYLVGELNGQTTYRSERTIEKSRQLMIGQKRTGEDIDQALAGQQGIVIKIGDTGALELEAYSPLKISQLKWVILSSFLLEEMLTPTLVGEQIDFFTKYIHNYNYHDLFMIHPQGKIFYTVKHEADYGTNLLTGKYKDSHLAKLIKEVLQTKIPAMSDYAPYEASNHEPAAFMAHPLMNNNQIQLIVAVQLNEASLNQIMQRRAGMGETGEAYLVGSDQLMRSNSFLAPETHSIRASFANPRVGKVDTESSREALAGKSGRKMITGYRGETVLSSYTPIKAGQHTWALIAEVNQTEAFAPIVTLQWISGTVAMIGILVIIGVAWGLTQSITRPLQETVYVLDELAQGNLVTQEQHKTFLNNELGLMQRSVCGMSGKLQQMILDMQNTVTAAKHGELTQRIATENLHGFMKELGENTNELVSTTAEFMQDLNQVIASVAKGNLNERPKGGYKGSYAQANTSLQTTIDNLKKIITEIQEVVNEAGRGKFDQLIDLSNKEGFSRELSQAMNTLLKIQKNFTVDMSYLLENLKNGDLTQPIKSEYVGDFDKIKRNANDTIEKLINMLYQIKQSIEALKQAIYEMEQNNNALSARNEEHASSLEETAAVTQELATTVEQNAHHAHMANQLSRSMTEVATKGEKIIEETINKIRQIHSSSQKIFAIIDVINGIVFQTNMLAINAAVEAARAGEHGRGFSIVALEVRNLAQRTAQAAEEIKILINDSVANVGVGLQLVEQTGEAMEEIMTHVKQVKDTLSNISTAIMEQGQGVKQINDTMVQMDKVSQENAAFVEEAAAHAEGLAHQASMLSEAFNQFKLN